MCVKYDHHTFRIPTYDTYRPDAANHLNMSNGDQSVQSKHRAVDTESYSEQKGYT